MLCGSALVIHDGNRPLWEDPTVNGSTAKRGLIPRDYGAYPVGCYAGIKPFHSVDLTPYAPGDWKALLKERRDAGALLSFHRRRGNNGGIIPSRDQNGKGYCWAHSGISAHLLVRAAAGQPYADLSAYAIACQIKNFRDEGGWGAQGVDWQIEHGVPTSKTWPQQSMNPANVNADMKADSMLHRVDEGWIDLQAAQYDRRLTYAQVVTCQLNCEPTINDYNWWSHSVCGMEPVDGASIYAVCRDYGSGKLVTLQDFERVWDMNDDVTQGIGQKIWNSWSDAWSDQGEGILPPSKCVPDGSVALRTVYSSPV